MSAAGGCAVPGGRPTVARIDCAAFAHNLRLAARLAGPGNQVLAVVKADAYGHGAVALAAAAVAADAAVHFGVATVEEARALRAAGIAQPVLLLSEAPPGCADEVVRLGLAQTLYTTALAEVLEQAGARAGRRVAVHLKIDTGMGRVGVAPAEAPAFAERLRAFPHLRLEGLMTHLSESERTDREVTARQLRSFEEVCGTIESAAGPVRWRHVANSALLLRGESRGNLVRPGLMLYGAAPGPGLAQAAQLRPVLSLRTAVAFLKRVPAGTPLSYGGTFTTVRESLVATLPIGYADGYRRRLSNRAEVLVCGRRAPLVGTICMDLCLADLTDIPGVGVGTEVVLLGRQGAEEITADELAGRAETISYEIFCGLGARVPRLPAGVAPRYDAGVGDEVDGGSAREGAGR